jgi:hypothetical protein
MGGGDWKSEIKKQEAGSKKQVGIGKNSEAGIQDGRANTSARPRNGNTFAGPAPGLSRAFPSVELVFMISEIAAAMS